jgi:hypothetical protein
MLAICWCCSARACECLWWQCVEDQRACHSSPGGMHVLVSTAQQLCLRATQAIAASLLLPSAQQPPHVSHNRRVQPQCQHPEQQCRHPSRSGMSAPSSVQQPAPAATVTTATLGPADVPSVPGGRCLPKAAAAVSALLRGASAGLLVGRGCRGDAVVSKQELCGDTRCSRQRGPCATAPEVRHVHDGRARLLLGHHQHEPPAGDGALCDTAVGPDLRHTQR